MPVVDEAVDPSWTQDDGQSDIVTTGNERCDTAMAAAQYELHDLDYLGLPARQVTITCRHGETTRVFVRERQRRIPRDRTLLRTTAEEHQAAFDCDCVQTLSQRRSRHR